jgi:hypothetical protein
LQCIDTEIKVVVKVIRGTKSGDQSALDGQQTTDPDAETRRAKKVSETTFTKACHLNNGVSVFIANADFGTSSCTPMFYPVSDSGLTRTSAMSLD